ncbi:MAG: hypothetical protein ACR2HV_07740 [Acidimicrobiales bacterium]
MTRTRATLVALMLVLAVAACGSESNEEKPLPTTPSDTSVTSVPDTGPAPATTAAPVAESGRSCAAILNDGVQLANSFRMESRGVAGPPDEAAFRARAQELLDEARARGCPVPAVVEQFLQYETDGSVE